MNSREPFVAALDAGSAAPSFAELLGNRRGAALVEALRAIEAARSTADNLYRRVRCCAYAAALSRFHLQDDAGLPHGEPVPVSTRRARLDRRFDQAIGELWACLERHGPGRMLLAELAVAYRAALFGDLARQVQRSVRASRGNRWLFRCGSLAEYPLRLHARLRSADPASGLYPVLEESTPVRLDLTHSGWSDIFFLAMENPELARVINASVNLAVGRPGVAPSGEPQAPIVVNVRVIDEAVLRLTAVDLGETRDLRRLADVFDFAADHLGLLKAAVVASGIVPPALEGTNQDLTVLLRVLVGPDRGLEISSQVRDIPKGSRLAVSTNLLAGLISALMRATGQTTALEGPLGEGERRIVASRAILGEWLGGSGGGWQDSGGIWPGFKAIEGVVAGAHDPEFGLSGGCLLPRHRRIDLAPAARDRIMSSLIVFHGGMAGNVGPVLELVTEAHLVGWQDARAARSALVAGFPAIEQALVAGDARTLGGLVHGLFNGPLPAIIPAVDNAFTQAVVGAARSEFAGGFWGFGMLGGMSGGGMSLWVDPAIRPRVEARFPAMLAELADHHRAAMPFVITPVLMRVGLDEQGTTARLRCGPEACFQPGYYRLHAPILARLRHDGLTPLRRQDLLNHLDRLDAGSGHADLLRSLVVHLLPDPVASTPTAERLDQVRTAYGFDAERQATLQARTRAGHIALARNLIEATARIIDPPADAIMTGAAGAARLAEARALLAAGAVGQVILAGGVGSRWSGGSGVVKGLSPFVRLGGQWRSFLELHLRRRRHEAGTGPAAPLLITASFLTENPIRRWLAALASEQPALAEGVAVSPGRGVCQRIVPTQADLHTWLAELPRPRLDAQAEKARQAVDRAWLAWAEAQGAASAYADNDHVQCLNPPGHWWELPSALLNGELARLLREQPQLRHLILHNVDTLGAGLAADNLAAHLAGGGVMTAEVVQRLSGDSGGSLASVDGQLRIVEGLAIPHESLELALRWYNSNTWWIDIDRWLAVFGLSRNDLADTALVAAAVRRLSLRLPTYLTIKLVKRRWGHGHEDQLPVGQFEQLLCDFTTLPDCPCRFLAVERQRGQQLKEIGHLADWRRDGSQAAVAGRAGLPPA